MVIFYNWYLVELWWSSWYQLAGKIGGTCWDIGGNNWTFGGILVKSAGVFVELVEYWRNFVEYWWHIGGILGSW